MAIRTVFYDDYNGDNWTVSDGWHTLKNQLVGVNDVGLMFSSTEVEIRLVLPTDDIINFYKDGANFVIDNGTSQQTAANGGDTSIVISFEVDSITFTWLSGSFSESVVYPFYQLSVRSVDKEWISISKDFASDYADNFATGVGYNGLRTYVEGNKIRVEPGYFYIGNQEYYMFNQMIVKDIIPLMADCYDYVEGAPYFIVPTANIDEDFGYVKTPNNLGYLVEWEDTTPSGYIPYIQDNITGYKLVYEGSPDSYREIIPSGVPSGVLPVASGILPVISDESYLVITDAIGDVSYIEHGSMWVAYSHPGSDYDFYTYVEDEYGAPLEGKLVTLKYIYEGAAPITIGTATTDERGVALNTLTGVGSFEDGFFVWAETSSTFRHSEPAWIQVPLATSIIRVGTFQLDNRGVMWDAQPARTAMGYNIWGEEWGSNTTEECGSTALPIYVSDWGDSDVDGESDHGDWESYKVEYKRPPITSILYGATVFSELDDPGPAGATNGYFTVKDYYDVIIPSGTFSGIAAEMRVSVNGFWGQFIITGAEIQDSGALQAQCQNPATNLYYIDRVVDYDGVETFGTLGDFNDVVGGGAGVRDLYYVIYYNDDVVQYSVANHAAIKAQILAGNYPFYFRGIAIYPILLAEGTNIEDAFSQNWVIDEITSEGELIE